MDTAELTNEDAGRLGREGEALRSSGRLAEAAHALEQALELDPALAPARHSLAQVRRAQGRLEEALAHVSRLTDERPDLPALWHLRAALHYEAGQPKLGAESLERYADLVQHDAVAQAQCAELYLHVGEMQKASALIARSRSADPTYSGAPYVSGRMLFEDGDTEAATEAYQEAVRLGLDLATPHGGRVVEGFVVPYPSWAKSGAGECRTLSPAGAFDLPRPEVIPAEEAHLWPEWAARFPEAFVGKLDHAEVLTREFTVLAPDGCFFTEGLVTSPAAYLTKRSFVKYASTDGRVLLDLRRDPIDVDRPCMLLGRSNNYFHFLIESLPRIWCAEQYPVEPTLPALVSNDLYPTQLELLALLGFPESRLIRVPMDTSVRCRTLYVPSLLNVGYAVPPRAVQFLRERILPRMPEMPELPRRVYLSRNRMPRRRLSNEAELLPILERHGFQTVYPEELGVAEQVRLFAQAEAILSPDSSSLANLAFAGPRARVGVLNWRGIHKPLWHCIAHHVGARVTYIHADPILESSAMLDHRDMHVEPALVQSWIDRLG